MKFCKNVLALCCFSGLAWADTIGDLAGALQKIELKWRERVDAIVKKDVKDRAKVLEFVIAQIEINKAQPNLNIVAINKAVDVAFAEEYGSDFKGIVVPLGFDDNAKHVADIKAALLACNSKTKKPKEFKAEITVFKGAMEDSLNMLDIKAINEAIKKLDTLGKGTYRNHVEAMRKVRRDQELGLLNATQKECVVLLNKEVAQEIIDTDEKFTYVNGQIKTYQEKFSEQALRQKTLIKVMRAELSKYAVANYTKDEGVYFDVLAEAIKAIDSQTMQQIMLSNLRTIAQWRNQFVFYVAVYDAVKSWVQKLGNIHEFATAIEVPKYLDMDTIRKEVSSVQAIVKNDTLLDKEMKDLLVQYAVANKKFEPEVMGQQPGTPEPGTSGGGSPTGSEQEWKKLINLKFLDEEKYKEVKEALLEKITLAKILNDNEAIRNNFKSKKDIKGLAKALKEYEDSDTPGDLSDALEFVS